MNDRSALPERRLDRRIPLGCGAAIHRPGGMRVEAECIELGIGGMTLHSAYVPGEAETIEVSVNAPNGTPLHVRLEVKRCHALGGGRYEIGGAIVQVLG